MTRLYIFILFIAWVRCEDPLPLCKICFCSNSNYTAAKVTCFQEIKTVLADRSTWINPKNNVSYDYAEITFANQNIIGLNFSFPKSNLTYLNMANSDIYRIAGSPFQNLQNMTTLILSFNELELFGPDAFKGLYMEERLQPLRSLRVLKLDHNRIHTLHMDIFEHTQDLEILDLSFNPLHIIDKHTLMAIDSLPFLKELYLEYTQIKTLPDQMLHTPKFLRILDLSGNPIDKVPFTLSEAHNLTTLYLNDTGFRNLTKENGFPHMPTLKTLCLCHTSELERIEKESLSGLVNLEELHISDNIKLNHIDGYALAQTNPESGGAIWPAIKKLHLGNNKLSYLDSSVIARWDFLIELDLRFNPWTCECENQWLIDDLFPQYLQLNREEALEVRCGAPIEMVEYSFYDLYSRNYTMRCLDRYGARPEKDAVLLVGVLAGVLIAIPSILFAIFAYQRKWFGIFSMCDNSPASYSRRFYNSAKNDDYF